MAVASRMRLVQTPPETHPHGSWCGPMGPMPTYMVILKKEAGVESAGERARCMEVRCLLEDVQMPPNPPPV